MKLLARQKKMPGPTRRRPDSPAHSIHSIRFIRYSPRRAQLRLVSSSWLLQCAAPDAAAHPVPSTRRWVHVRTASLELESSRRKFELVALLTCDDVVVSNKLLHL